MASAALDRLLHRSTVINIRGESYRLKAKMTEGGQELTLIDTVPKGSVDCSELVFRGSEFKLQFAPR